MIVATSSSAEEPLALVELPPRPVGPEDVRVRVRATGVTAGNRVLTADFQGGLYSFDGFYPGATMQTVIANEFLAAINKTYGTSYPPADVAVAAATDPVLRMIPAARRSRLEVR